MPYFLSEEPLSQGEAIVLEGTEAIHLLQSRRIRVGDKFVLQDPGGNRFQAELTGSSRGKAEAVILETVPVPDPPPVQVTILQAAVKEKAAEWIIQKGTETGVERIVFFQSNNSTVSSRQLETEKNQERWHRIAWEACKQCERQFPPSIELMPNLTDALEKTKGGGAWVLDWAQGVSPETARRRTGLPPEARLLVGPEGGLKPQEIDLAKRAGFLPVRIGNTILRAETAALVGLSLLIFSD